MSQHASPPLVSAIVSTYRAERFLAGCLDSLLAQTIAGRLEIIVIDSASPENEAAIVARYREQHPNIAYLRTPERENLYQAWNRGVRLSRGTYVTNANTDDRLRPDALEVLVQALESRPEAALAYGDVVVSRIANRPFDWNLRDGWIARPDFEPAIMASGCHMGPQPLWRRSLHDEIGFFDESLRTAADYDFWCRVALRHPMAHIPELLGSYYDNPEGICNAAQDLNAREAREVMTRYRREFPLRKPIATSPPPYVNVAMVTYNRLEFTRHAVSALTATVDYPYVLNVVDNGSSDGTREYLEELKKKGVIRNLSLLPENVGVAKAANLAWSMEPEAAYYLKLDNDIVMTKPRWLGDMVKMLASDPEMGAVAYNFEPRSYPESRRLGKLLRIKTGNLGGACILIPRRTFERLGYWCEDYGLYGEEDFDYGERLRLAGLLNAYMVDEDAGLHLPAGKAAVIDARASARDGMEETLHAEYRAGKDQSRRHATGLFGQVERNLADYASGRKPLRCESAFVDARVAGKYTSARTLRPSLRAALSVLGRRARRLAASIMRSAGSLSTLLSQAGPAVRLLIRGRPGIERALAIARSNAQYRRWLAQDAISSADRYAMTRLLQGLEYKPLISVLMPVWNAPEAVLRQAIESVCRQAYPHWQLCIADDASSLAHVQTVLDEYAAREPRLRWVKREARGHIVAASNTALTLAEGEFVALLDHDDELAEDALLLIAWQLNQTRGADILYSDEDKIDSTGRRFAPDFKPDWNPDLMLGQNACGHLGVYRASLVRQIGGFRPGTEGCQDWDLSLRIAEMTSRERIVHLPFVLYHWRASISSTAGRPSAKDYVSATACRVVAAALERRGVRAEAFPAPGNHVRLRYPVPSPVPRVSILVPCHIRDTDSVSALVHELANQSPWPDLEILVAGSRPSVPEERPGICYFDDLANASVATQGNGLAAAATGDVLIFLRPALAAPGHDALSELVSHALRLEIGAVTPRLEARGRVIEAGLILGLNGPAGAAYRGMHSSDRGVAGRAGLAQDRTVAAANCMAVRREVFVKLGGFADVDFPELFYDLDFCLRLGELGLKVLWTPDARVQVRNIDALGTGTSATCANELVALRRRWGKRLLEEHSYNPNLALDRAWPTPALIPRLTKPYRLT